MKVFKYSIRRTINCGNYESIAFEYGVEVEVKSKKDEALAIEEVEIFMENKEDEIRKQLS